MPRKKQPRTFAKQCHTLLFWLIVASGIVLYWPILASVARTLWQWGAFQVWLIVNGKSPRHCYLGSKLTPCKSNKLRCSLVSNPKRKLIG